MQHSNKQQFLTEYQDELAVALRDCIQHHQMLMQFCKMLEHFLNPYILVKSLQLTFQLCNLSFTLLKVSKLLALTFRLHYLGS